MADEATTAGQKREREDDAEAGDHEEEPSAKEARVDGDNNGAGVADDDHAQAPCHIPLPARVDISPAVIHERRTGRELGFHPNDPRGSSGNFQHELVVGKNFPMPRNDAQSLGFYSREWG